METYKFVLQIFCILSIGFINYALELETEGIYNGHIADYGRFRFQAAIFGVEFHRDLLKYLGSGSLVSSNYVLSAAHFIVDGKNLGTYQLNPLTFYVRLGSYNLNRGEGETIYVDTFYVLDYNVTTGEDDLILIKLGPNSMQYYVLHHRIFVAVDGQDFRRSETTVQSYGVHSTESDMDYKLRWSLAEIVNNSNCDHILEHTTQICVKMEKPLFGQPRGLCKFDGGAPLITSDQLFLIAIASKPKENCDDTERGSIYTDVRQFQLTIDEIVNPSTPYDGPVLPATSILNNNPRTIL